MLVATTVAPAAPTAPAPAPRTLADYRYFRALSIDLLGRAPTRDELAVLDRPDFSFEHWLDEHLTGARYSERLRRIYADLLRLELPLNSQFEPAALRLHRAQIAGPHGPLEIYFRPGQRRTSADTDGQLCFTQDETGIVAPPEGPARGTAKPITQQLLDDRTVEIAPWWLYADYRSKAPHDRIGASADWAKRFPGYLLSAQLFVEPTADHRDTQGVRVCKEEAQTLERGHVVATGQVAKKHQQLAPGRLTARPGDTPFAKAHAGELVSCTTGVGYQSSPECGCGVGLERCLPTGPPGFDEITQAPLGDDLPFATLPRPASMWLETFWAAEPQHFMDRIFGEDRDVRELVTSRATMVNGPLAQFYRFFANATCCGTAADLGYAEPEPLVDPAAVPTQLVPEDVDTWQPIADRGPHAAGILTMPVFLMKYASRRQRAHVLYQAFLCRDFVAEKAKLLPSTEPDLTKRPGCASCHTTLEPLAAYFSRVTESDWTYLPADKLPVRSKQCERVGKGKGIFSCHAYYDPAFTTDAGATLRGAYASPEHADAGPPAFGAALASSPEFAPCVVKNVAQSLLGRPLAADDDAWKRELTKRFVDGGYKLRPLVRAILTSASYRAVSADRAAAAPPPAGAAK